MNSSQILYKHIIDQKEINTEVKEVLNSLKLSDSKAYLECLIEIHELIDFPKLFPDLFSDLIKFTFLSFDASKAVNNLERFIETIYDKNYLFTIFNNNKWLLKALIFMFSGSQFLSDIVIKEPYYFDFLRDPNTLQTSKTKDQMQRELSKLIEKADNLQELYRALRQFKRMQFLRIGTRDLLMSADLTETMDDISNVADVCLHHSYMYCEKELISRFGAPFYENEEGTTMCRNEFAVIGMGKLGGHDLNFSSDIDIMYLYASVKGSTKGGGISLSSHEFYVKLSTMITKAMSELTDLGNVFRVDLNLRPEGQSGDIAYSLAAYEIYYQSWGETWERQALIKARTVAGNEALGKKFQDFTQRFIFRKYLDLQAIDEIRNMKDKVNKLLNTVKIKKNDIKLGKGGVREIEFVAQALQLLYGGRDKVIREKNTLKALFLLNKSAYIPDNDYQILSDAYCFLRNLEHRIQISHGLQTHKIPLSKEIRDVLAKKMNISGLKNEELSNILMIEYETHINKVRIIYDNLLAKKVLPDEKSIKPINNVEEEMFNNQGEVIVSDEFFKEYSFTDILNLKANLTFMYKGHAYKHASIKSQEYMKVLVFKILRFCNKSPNPDQAINNLEKFFSKSVSKEDLILFLIENQSALSLLCYMFGASNFLANILIVQPNLIDIIFYIDGINSFKTKKNIYDELLNILKTTKSYGKFLNEIRKYQKGEALRIALKFISGKAILSDTTGDLTKVAEAVLNAALLKAEEKVSGKYGKPYGKVNGVSVLSRLAIIGMGKLGGSEIDFGSDLDLIYIYSYDGETTGDGINGNTVIDNNFYFTKVCETLFKIIAEVREYGDVYKIDSRLRPEGKKGVLVVSSKGFLDYISKRGQTWERQSLIKARAVAGDLTLGKRFVKKTQKVIYCAPFHFGIRKEISDMRLKMEQEFDVKKKGMVNIKFGLGGLVDIEFIVQFLILKYGISDPTLRTPKTVKALDTLNVKGFLSPDDYITLKSSYEFYRQIQICIRLENAASGNTLKSSNSIIGKFLKYKDTDELTAASQLMRDYKRCTMSVRAVYNKIFGCG